MLLTNLHFLHINSIREPTFLLRNLDVIDARHSLAHLALLLSVFLKGPVFKTIRSIPLTVFVMVLVEKLNSLWIDLIRDEISNTLRKTDDLIVLESKELLLKTIAVLDRIFLRQEGDDLISSFDELITIAPYTIFGVCCMIGTVSHQFPQDSGVMASHISRAHTFRDRLWVLGVPGILSELDLLQCSFSGERREYVCHDKFREAGQT